VDTGLRLGAGDFGGRGIFFRCALAAKSKKRITKLAQIAPAEENSYREPAGYEIDPHLERVHDGKTIAGKKPIHMELLA
jgi:hypothetical protein